MNRSEVPEGSGEQRKIEETGCEDICGAPTTPGGGGIGEGEGEVRVGMTIFLCLG